jgi:4-alpha-glucanotransferase
MNFERSSGILLHPTSLPGPYGIGDLGPQAYQWVDFLEKTGTKLWQVLPLGPTGYGDSPYQCFSAFAGNPYLISPELLLDDGLLGVDDLEDIPEFPMDRVDFGPVIRWKLDLLGRAFRNFSSSGSSNLQDEMLLFQEENKYWLPDFALYMALKEAHGGNPWSTWEKSLRVRTEPGLVKAKIRYHLAIQEQIFRQFIFFHQWGKLKQYANTKGIQIVGDIPIFVAHDSAEVWARPDLFYINQKGKPTVVAGVPPDYFSPTGQLWGNPLYRWDVHKAAQYDWWIERFRAVFKLVDIVRLDHFRGFAGYWEIPAREKTAIKGKWVGGPGIPFFKAIQKALTNLPIIAEDLGEITPDVVEMREYFKFPGMKILVFAFGDDATNEFLPHNFIRNCVVYTGTHDNDTSVGWYSRVDEAERDFARRYLGRSGTDIAWDLIRTAWSSVAVMAFAPMQDLLSLDNQARMNYPSRPSGNWSWRMQTGALTRSIENRLAEFNLIYRRGVPLHQEIAEPVTEPPEIIEP